jgi:hypothetical protein
MVEEGVCNPARAKVEHASFAIPIVDGDGRDGDQSEGLVRDPDTIPQGEVENATFLELMMTAHELIEELAFVRSARVRRLCRAALSNNLSRRVTACGRTWDGGDRHRCGAARTTRRDGAARVGAPTSCLC